MQTFCALPCHLTKLFPHGILPSALVALGGREFWRLCQFGFVGDFVSEHPFETRPVVAIIQARMASSRLPGKVMKPIGDKPMLEWVVRRARSASRVDLVVVATTTDPSDDELAAWCARQGIPCYRGHPYDVLDRYYKAAFAYRAAIVVRLTADCPFLDPNLVDGLVERFLSASPRLDFAANRLPQPWGRSFPIGLDAEVMTAEALERAWREADEPHQREHVTPYFYDDAAVDALRFDENAPPWRETSTPRGFRIALWHAHFPLGDLRWTVDTPQDLQFARALAALLPDGNFSWREVLRLLSEHPELQKINANVKHKTHRDVDERMIEGKKPESDFV